MVDNSFFYSSYQGLEVLYDDCIDNNSCKGD